MLEIIRLLTNSYCYIFESVLVQVWVNISWPLFMSCCSLFDIHQLPYTSIRIPREVADIEGDHGYHSINKLANQWIASHLLLRRSCTSMGLATMVPVIKEPLHLKKKIELLPFTIWSKRASFSISCFFFRFVNPDCFETFPLFPEPVTVQQPPSHSVWFSIFDWLIRLCIHHVWLILHCETV